MNLRFHSPSSRASLRPSVRVFDALCAALAPLSVIGLSDAGLPVPDIEPGALLRYVLVALPVTLAVLAVIRLGDRLTRYFSLDDAMLVMKAALVSVAATALVMFTLTRLDLMPRSVIVLHGVMLTALLIGGRLIARWRHAGRDRPVRVAGRQNALVIGTDRLSALFLEIVEANPQSRLNVAAVIDPNAKLVGRTLRGRPIVGAPSSIATLIEEFKVHGVVIDRVIVAAGCAQVGHAVMATVRTQCAEAGLVAERLDDRLGLAMSPDAEAHVQARPATITPAAASAEPEPAPLHRPWDAAVLPHASARRPHALGFYHRVKRLIDCAAAAGLGLALAPVALAVAVLVYCDVGGPVLFWQQRVGRNGSKFLVYKFRTFHAPYDRFGRPRLERARLSRIGHWLRRTRLDELPQLYNVLVGDMSLIGPRPLLPVDLPENDDTRLSVRPGLTGWAQVNGGKLLSVGEKNLLDCWYIANASLWLDCLVVLKTVEMMLAGERANPAALHRAASAQPERLSPAPSRPEPAAALTAV